MNCAKWEPEIALHAGGDLPAADVPRIERHLAECANCRALLEDLRAGQDLLAELRDEPLEDAMLLQVRRNVLGRADFSPRGTSVPLHWKLALAAALVLAVVLEWPRHRIVNPTPVAHEAPHPLAAPPVKIVPVRHRVMRRRNQIPAAAPAEPLVVQFVTNDPTIVVYWIVDPKPQGD
jgi:anti-sigma factor RsiW